MFAVTGHPSHSIIFDASHGHSSQAQIHAGVLRNYLTEFQRNAVDGVIHSAVPEDRKTSHLMGGETPSAKPSPATLPTKKSPTHSSPGSVYFPGSAAKYN